jgi:hypothetical protein
LADKKTIDSYFNRLKIKDGKVDLDTFREFMAMLDMVLVDGDGNLLGLDDFDKAIDLSNVDDDEDEAPKKKGGKGNNKK